MFIPGFRKREKMNVQIVDATDELDEGEDDEDEDYEEPDPEEMRQQVYEWAREWLQTPAFKALTDEQKGESEGVIANFTAYMYSDYDATPEQWNVADMEECCLQTLPRKISTEESYFQALAPVLASFFTFLQATGRLRHGAAMARRILGMSKKIIAVANDPRNWGMAKSFAMTAMAKGVDLTDDRQMQSFAMDYNASILGSEAPPIKPDYEEDWEADHSSPVVTYVREGPKVGRNDACPCGSGKKYKKCCGSA